MTKVRGARGRFVAGGDRIRDGETQRVAIVVDKVEYAEMRKLCEKWKISFSEWMRSAIEGELRLAKHYRQPPALPLPPPPENMITSLRPAPFVPDADIWKGNDNAPAAFEVIQ